MSGIRSATQSVVVSAVKPATGHVTDATPQQPVVPANAIYAAGQPIPNPVGDGYLTYGAIV